MVLNPKKLTRSRSRGALTKVKRQAFVVLGMHRSGTSSVAGTMVKLGVSPPKTLLGANSGNERGHWESTALIDFHNELLASAGSRWDDWRPFRADWYETSLAGEFKARAKTLLKEEFGGASTFVLKDPRICRFARFWLEVLADEGIEAKLVLPLRSPLEVAQSHRSRDRLPIRKGLLLWLRHVLDAEAATRDAARVYFEWTTFLQDWQAVALRLEAVLGIRWPALTDYTAREVERFLGPELKHQNVPDAELASNPELHSWVLEAYEALRELVRNPGSPSAFTRLDAVRGQFDEATRLFGGTLAEMEVARTELEAKQQAERDASAHAQEQLLQERDRLLAREQELQARIHALEVEREAKADELARLTAMVGTIHAGADQVLVTLREELGAALDNDRQVRAAEMAARDATIFALQAERDANAEEIARLRQLAEAIEEEADRNVAVLRQEFEAMVHVERKARAAESAAYSASLDALTAERDAKAEEVARLATLGEALRENAEEAQALLRQELGALINSERQARAAEEAVHDAALKALEAERDNKSDEIARLARLVETLRENAEDAQALMRRDFDAALAKESRARDANASAHAAVLDELRAEREARANDVARLVHSAEMERARAELTLASLRQELDAANAKFDEGQRKSLNFEIKALEEIESLKLEQQARRATEASLLRDLRVAQRDKERLQGECGTLMTRNQQQEGDLANAMRRIDELEAALAEAKSREETHQAALRNFRKSNTLRRRLFGNIGPRRRAAFTPLQQLEWLGEHAGVDRWRMTGGDPAFLLQEEVRRRGHYRFEITSPDGIQAFISPRLYVDSGNGFNEEEAIDLNFVEARTGRFSAVLYLPRGARALRFDPSIKPGTINLSQPSLFRVTRVVNVALIAYYLTRRRKSSPAALARGARRLSSALWRSGPRAAVAEIYRAYSSLHIDLSDAVADIPITRPGSQPIPLLSYDSEYQPPRDVSGLTTDIKAIAFHLPQFHQTPENDAWWGEGFTEWVNTKKARPRFNGHYQPREPHADLGYYDLSDVEALRKQALLARRFGIHGFCFYHYWFSGRRVLSKPVDILLSSPDIDINFCLCWANENWTRAWDGLEKDILLEQRYLEDDPVRFIEDIYPYISDPRYIRVDGKPVILVYKPHVIPDVGAVFDAWRRHWRAMTGGELEIWCVRTNFEDTNFQKLRKTAQFDAVVEFPPHVVPYWIDQRSIGLQTEGHLFNYQGLVADILSGTEIVDAPDRDFYRSVMLGWDNSARREAGWSVWYGFSLRSYYRWLAHVVKYTRANFPLERRFLFINAWNEWAEGTYLEPDKRCGYASLNTTALALFDLPLEPDILVPQLAPSATLTPSQSVAVHLHFYFEETAGEMAGYLANIPFVFDLIVTTDTASKGDVIKRAVESIPCLRSCEIIVVSNRGRDVGPLLFAVSKRLLKYQYVAHIHTKKSTTVGWGERWRWYLLDNLMGSSAAVWAIFNEFESDPTLGVLYPPSYPLIAPYADWAGLRDRADNLLQRLSLSSMLPAVPHFPAGSMFWARTEAIEALLRHDWDESDFEEEDGQLGDTMAHCVERLWGYVGVRDGFRSAEILSKEAISFEPESARRRVAIFVHYDQDDEVSENDLYLIESIKAVCDDVIFVSHSALPETSFARIGRVCSTILTRENKGYDFSGWRYAMEAVGRDNLAAVDELLLVNNSTFGPVIDLDEMLGVMAKRECDFWGITSFPHTLSSKRAEAALLAGHTIPAHLQSYFLVFRSSVLRSDTFWDFWSSVEPKEDIVEVVAAYETKLTVTLEQAGFTWSAYLPEAAIMQERNNDDVEYNAPYSDPVSMVKLRNPLIKKKSSKYSEELGKAKKIVAALGYYPVGLAD